MYLPSVPFWIASPPAAVYIAVLLHNMDSLTEKCKNVLTTLLQFKKMLLFMNEHLSDDLGKEIDSLSPGWKDRLDSLLIIYHDLIYEDEQNAICVFIQEKESNFALDDVNCCPTGVFLPNCDKSMVRKNTRNKDKHQSMQRSVRKRKIDSRSNRKKKHKQLSMKKGNKIISKSGRTVESIVCDVDLVKEESCDSNEDALSTDSDGSTLYLSENEDDSAKEAIAEECSDLFGIPISYSCSHENCKFRNLSLSELRAHELRNHANKTYGCPQAGCDLRFTTGVDLSGHLTGVHQVFQCIINKCNVKFSNEFKLNMHIKREHGNAYLTCTSCDKTFKNRTTMKKHSRMMHVEGTFSCKFDNCDFVAKFRKELLYHKTTKHLLKTCPECGRSVPSNCFQRHLKVHKQIRDYVCSWPDCGKAFSESKTLKDHVRIHLNFKRYRCKWPQCSYACEQQSNLITHIRVRHFKVPQTKKKQLEMNISLESIPDPFEYMQICNEDICIQKL